MLLEISIALVFVLCFIQWRKRPARFPPGPFSWPIVGNFVQVGMEPYKTVMKMRKKYGNIIGIDLGPKRAVFINEYKLLKEAFNMPGFSGRPPMPHLKNSEDGDVRGIVLTSGKHWLEQRRFAFSYIQAGFRNGVPVEKLISHESKEMIGFLKQFRGQPISTEKLFNHSVINSLWTSIAGERFRIEDEKFVKLAHYAEELLASPENIGLLVFFPKLCKLVPKISGFDYCQANMMNLCKFSQETIDAHISTTQEGVERDFIDSYLKKIKTTTDTQSSFYSNIGNENLRRTLFDLFIAGIDTVTATLRWVIFLMAYSPDVQEKLRCTIVNYIETHGQISLKDRPKLPYLEASIAEILRFSSIGALGVFHEAVEDVEFHGYLIPKGTMIIGNHFGIHHNPEVWGDPENFRPERFLTSDESEVIRHPALTPFSTGKRVCPGESLARDELFIFIVNLYSHFRIEFDPSEPTPPLIHTLGVALAPPKHKVIFQNILL